MNDPRPDSDFTAFRAFLERHFSRFTVEVMPHYTRVYVPMGDAQQVRKLFIDNCMFDGTPVLVRPLPWWKNRVTKRRWVWYCEEVGGSVES